jgi:hypothetical protein
MNRTAVSLAIVALGLAACASSPSPTEQRVATTEMPFHAGQGVVIAATQARPPISAAAGGTVTAVSTTPANYRLAIRMDDGTVQYVDTDAAEIAVGSRVQLGADHTIRAL